MAPFFLLGVGYSVDRRSDDGDVLVQQFADEHVVLLALFADQGVEISLKCHRGDLFSKCDFDHGVCLRAHDCANHSLQERMTKMKSVMKHQFSQVPRADIPRSSFDRSHGYKTTFDSGYLVPIYVDDVLPGDSFNLNMHGFARLATPLHPFMDNVFMDVFFFFVPNRLVWNNFQKFFGEQTDPGDSTDFVVPTMTSGVGGYASNSLHDYFGLPTLVAGIEHISLFHRAYNLIWNEWFRDQNLQDSVVVDKDDGPDDPADYVLLRRGKRHDYFTSCLPWPQKGPAVELPLGLEAPLVFEASSDMPPSLVYNAVAGVPIGSAIDIGGGADAHLENVSGGTDLALDITGHTHADLSTATAATINQLRQAFQIQKIYERDARGGTRYTELIQAHFGVTSPDARLQRPEFLGGGSVPVNVNPIAQTSSTDGEPTPQGNLAAMGTVHINRIGFTKSFTEHGMLIGLANVRADLNYQQGLLRMFSRSTRWDFYWPALAHIGEQAVLNKEIYAQGTSDDEEVFGYQERYAEYRYKPSLVTGTFRSNHPQSLDTWHLAQDFSALPTLSPEFIEENPPLERVLAVETEPQFLLDCYFQLRCARPMPVYSVPGLIDHF